jgi:hypothetical protein
MSSALTQLNATSPSPADVERPYERVIVARRRQQGLALGVAAATLTMMMWGLGRPALWLDESASVIATQRTWAGLLVMLSSTDAPLVPYYALLKAASSAVTSIAPGSAASPEVLFRWPSVAVTVLATWALTLWLARRCPPELAISTGALLLGAGLFSRYAQEARPYAFALAAAVACTILWTRLIRDRRRRWVVLYALAVASLVAAHLLAAGLVFAHVVAAAATSSRGNRRSIVLRTSGAAALGLLVVSPIAVTAALQGQGPRLKGSLPAFVPPFLVDAVTEGGVLALGLGAAAVLAVCVARAVHPRYQFIARLAVAWAVVPLAVLFPLVLLRPNLLQVRYIVFVLPGWAILGGLCIVILMDLMGRALARLAGGTGSNGESRGLLITAATYSVGVLAVAGVVASQVDTLKGIRTPGGHGEDIRPALAAASRKEYAQLPIVFSPPRNALEIAPYARAEEHRLSGVHLRRDQPSIWPVVDPPARRKHHLRQHDRVVLLLKAARTGDCRSSALHASATHVSRCLPEPFQERAYQVESAEAVGREWTFAVLTYQTPDA